MNHQALCDPNRIDLFLDRKLSDDEQSAFESHLTECDDCCRRLESSTASDDVWRHVRDCLGDEHDDSELDSAAGEEISTSQATILKLLAPTDDDRMIGRWGTYEVVGVVGTGGMGVVLKAFDAALNRYVAIKILAPHLGTSGAAIRRFSREGKAAAAVVHDNVIEIYGVSEAGGLPYLVMPYVRGPSLQRRLNDEGPLAVVEILRVAMQAAAGLAAAHAQGLVHRDVKPANILLADGIERVKLTDFGLARAADDASLTRTGVIAGTPQYMSPEQARGEPVDPRSDLFSLGSVLYAMCTGRPPFRAETSYGVLRRITDEEPRPIREINPDVPDWLCGIVSKLMAKRPDDRFQSAHEVAALLEQCLAHVQQPTAVPLPTVSGTLRVPSASGSPLLPGEGQGVRAAASSRKHLLKGTLAMLTLLGLSLFAVGVVSTNPPDISGTWQGEDWGQVTLTQTVPGQYTGTYTDTVAKEKGPGKIAVKWSRIERRFNGTWREGEDARFGDLSVRLDNDKNEIRGALTTDAKSKINPATPRLADLTWVKINASAETDKMSIAIDGSNKLAIQEIRLEKDKIIVSGQAPAGAAISFYAGDLKNACGCTFPKSTRFSASLDYSNSGLNCHVATDSSDPILALVGAKNIGAIQLADGQFIYGSRGVHKESDGAETVAIGKWVRTSGEEIPLGVTLTPPPVASSYGRGTLHDSKEKVPGTVSFTPSGASPPHASAVQFDGEHYAKVEPPPKFTSGDFTISLWFNPTTAARSKSLFHRGFSWSDVLRPYPADDVTHPHGAMHFGRDYRGDINMHLNIYSGELVFAARTANHEWLFGWDVPESRLHSPVHYGQWNHVVVTRRGDSYTMWMNGARINSEKSQTQISDTDNTNPFLVGGMMEDDGGACSVYCGSLDDFRIFRRCLSDKEIGTLYDCGGDVVALNGEGRVKFGPLAQEKESSNRALTEAEADVKQDLQRGSPKYYRIGKPIRHSGQWKAILNRDYGIELVDLGCIGSEYAEKYNAVVLRELTKKHGADFVAKSEAEAIREEEKSRGA